MGSVPVPVGATFSPLESSVPVPQGASFQPVSGPPTNAQEAIANPPVAQQPINAQNMQTSSLPGMIQKTGYALPLIGGGAGALGGAAAGGAAGGVGAFAGAPVGGALGAGAGENLRMAIMNKIFGVKGQPSPEPSPTSAAGLKQIVTAAGLAGVSEVPAGVLQGMGSIWLKQLAVAKSSKQVGDVIAAMEEQSPAALSKGGFIKKLADTNEQLSSQLGRELNSAQGQVNIDNVLQPVRSEAAVADLHVKGVAKQVEDTIQAAKFKAGITGNTANAQQLADFNNYLRDVKKVYTAAPSANVTATTQPILMKADSNVRMSIRALAPKAADIYDQMTDVHAAMSAVKDYSPGIIRSAGITAATHPKTMAAVSPLVIPAAVASEKGAGDVVKKVASKF